MRPSKPEDFPLLWVWSSIREHAVKRRALWINRDGSCEALSHGRTDIIHYKNCEEIKDHEYMTREQAVCFMAQNPTYVVRHDTYAYLNRSQFNSDIEMYEWATTDGYKYGEPHKFTTDYLEVSDE